MRKRKVKLRRVAGGNRKAHAKQHTGPDLHWWRQQLAVRPFAAVATRKLRFAQINRVLQDRPPSLVRSKDYRVYLFRTGEDRDTFIEQFHGGFGAHAIPHAEA